eukprot:gene19065-24118_t
MPAATASPPIPGVMPALRPATVIAHAGDRLLLRTEPGGVPASVPLSCPLAPQVGDQVLAWAGGEEWHILAVLGRETRPAWPAESAGMDDEAKP